MAETPHQKSQLSVGCDEVLARFGLSAESIFTDERVRVWRDLPERQNCTMDSGNRWPRLHIKRYKAPFGEDALREARAIALLRNAAIPTVLLLAFGTLPDGRGFLVTEDLAGMMPADRAMAQASGDRDGNFIEAIAELAAKLHRAELHHRDLYLCHFFVNPKKPSAAVHLIDPGRVARLPIWPMHYRWIIKDVAQLYYSVTDAGLGTGLRDRLFAAYLRRCGLLMRALLRCCVPVKAAMIARHDRRLRRRQPGRRVSIDSASGT